jgi:hypothetical protein
MNRAIFLFLCFASCAVAEQPWPERVMGASLVEERTAKLPKPLREALTGLDEFSQGTGKLPDSLYICRVDLACNGQEDFIVESQQSYSGGSMMNIFERRKKTFVEIGETQGSIYFARPGNGYLEIVSQARAGGGIFTRTLQRYGHGRYHIVRIADYRIGESGVLEFVQERKVKETER